MQKKYIVDHLGKKTCLNRGKLPQYFVSDNHEAIIDREISNRVQEEFVERKTKYKDGITTTATYPFTGKIVCGQCGSHYRRKLNNAGTKYQKVVWICSTYNSFGKEKCSAKQIPEDILVSLVKEVLLITEFDENAIKLNIKEIQVHQNNLLVFVLINGQSVEKEWQYKSRSESWNEESKQQARERQLKSERRNQPCVQQEQ